MKTFKVYTKDDFISNFINNPNGGIFSFLNPYSCLNSTKNINEIIYGVDSYYLSKIFLKIDNISFDNSSFAPFFFDYCVNFKKKVLFIGATINENNLFINSLKQS